MFSQREKKKYAKKLRKNATGAERVLRPYMWVAGYKFQAYDAAGYLPDFYSKFAGVAVEIDGSIHKRKDVKQMDRYKDRARRSKQNYTMRVSNWRGENLPMIVMIEAIMTGVIYWTWKTMVALIKYVWRGVKL